jgi:hypothetical protein
MRDQCGESELIGYGLVAFLLYTLFLLVGIVRALFS